MTNAKLVVENNRATVEGTLDRRLNALIPNLEGGKRWLRSGGFSFEATPGNLERFRAVYPDVVVSDFSLPSSLASGLSKTRKGKTRRPAYIGRRPSYGHQTRALEKWGNLPVFAVFAEMGTGKSKIIIDRAGKLWSEGLISGVLIVCKKGPHDQWIDEQVPEHLGEMVPRRGYAWSKGKKLPKDFYVAGDGLDFFAINVDAVNTEKGFRACEDFIRTHGGHVLMAVDESQTIKSYRAQRTVACVNLGKMCDYRVIATGTPIAKDLTDEWSQFKFLDEKIIGHRYITSFRGEYCRMGGFQNRVVVGHKNVERFFARIEPYVFRVTKEEELDLPPKVYAVHRFSMTDEQKRHYDSMKDSFLTQMESGEVSSVAIAATALLRLQQITCGFLPVDGEEEPRSIDNPRLDALMEVVESRPGKKIIWARFRHDIKAIEARLNEEGLKTVTYFGDTRQNERKEAVAKWLNATSEVDVFISNPAAGGVGLNLQGDCRTAIYYSNSFNAIDRWQSEDRIHRIGTTGTVTYIDLVCAKSIDPKILTNLRGKKSLSDLMLDDIRKMVEG